MWNSTYGSKLSVPYNEVGSHRAIIYKSGEKEGKRIGLLILIKSYGKRPNNKIKSLGSIK